VPLGREVAWQPWFVSDDDTIRLLIAELKKLRGRKGVLSLAKLSEQRALADTLSNDLDWAYEVLRGVLARASVHPSMYQRAGALSLVIEQELVGDRLEAAGRLMNAEARTVRHWGDTRGFREIAGNLLHAASSQKAVARQTTYVQYPTDEQGLAMHFSAELPAGDQEFKVPVIKLNDREILSASDHFVRADEARQAVEHSYSFEVPGIPLPPEGFEGDNSPVLKLEFTIPVDYRFIHRFVSDFRSNTFYVSCQSLGQSQVTHVVWQRPPK
jgi:hypothetical protein